MANKIDSLRVECFKAFKEGVDINPGKFNLLMYGDNGAGKSSVYDALKLVFFYHRIEEEHRVGATPDEQRAQLATYLANRYDHKGKAGFVIKINGDDYQEFISHDDFQDYHVSMVCNSDIQVGEYISYKELLKKVY